MKRSKRKAWGQHFLTDRNVLQKIIKVIDPQPEDFIIEIGAGSRGLSTRPILPTTGRLRASLEILASF